MLRSIIAFAVAFAAATPVHAQYVWTGPFDGTTFWSAGLWAPAAPPNGGLSTTSLTFNQIGAGANYTATNNLGNPFQLNSLNFTGLGGGITIGSAAGNTLGFSGAAQINHFGLGYSDISSSLTLSPTSTTFGGNAFGTLRVSGVISGSGPVIINRPQINPYNGFVEFSGANTFNGGVTLQAGTLQVNNGAALGTGTLNFAGGWLTAGFSQTIGNAVTLNSDFRYAGSGDMNLTGNITELGSRNMVVASQGGGRLFLHGESNHSGVTSIEASPQIGFVVPSSGTLVLRGLNGSINQSRRITISAGGQLMLDNRDFGNNNNRVSDVAPIIMSGGELTLGGNPSAHTAEDAGSLSGQGAVSVFLNAIPGGNTALLMDSLVRTNRGQFNFRASGFGFGIAPAAFIANLVFGNAPALTNGIIPYALGSFTSSGTTVGLVTYGSSFGVRLLTDAEYSTVITSGNSDTNNYRLTAAQAITAPTQIGALVIATASPFTGSTSTLSFATGTVLNTSTATIPAEMTLAFGANEAVFFTSGSLTVNGALTGTNGLTKGGSGVLVLNNANNNVTGSLTVNQGLISFSDPAALGSFGDIKVSGTAAASPPGLVFNPTTGSGAVNKPMTVTDGFVRFRSGGSNSTLIYAGAISGSGGVLVDSGNVELINTNNSYTGQTRVFNGNLLVGSDSVLGNGGGVDIGSSTTTGLRLTGHWTTSRQINFSDNAQVNTNGFNWTINSPLTGTASNVLITKIGDGIWTLTQGGSLGQSSASTAPGTPTLRVSGGELRATNFTGSATGLAIVTVNAGSIISGTGRFGGATTVDSGAIVSPGLGGSTIGTLEFGNNLTINGFYTANLSSTIGDRVNVLGILTLGGGSVLQLSGGTLDPNTTFTLMNFASLTGTFSAVGGLPVSHNLIYNSTSLQLVPVPEPEMILGAAAAVFLVGRQVWRRKQIDR